MRFGKKFILDWKSRGDGSHWAQCRIGGEPAVIALTQSGADQLSATAIIEIETASNYTDVEEALVACENWLTELGATPDQRLALGARRRTTKDNL